MASAAVAFQGNLHSLPRSPIKSGVSRHTSRHSLHRLSMASDAKKRVVITGLGAVTAVGSGDELWNNLLNGVSGIDRVTKFDPSQFPTQIAGEVKDFDPKPYYKNPKMVKQNDDYTHYSMAASKMALEDASLDAAGTDPTKFGIMVGSAFGGMATYEEQTLKLDAGKKVSPFTISALLGNMASGIIAIEVGAQGPNFGVVSACASGSHAIGEAMRLIQNGEADVMVAGGSEASITPLSFAGFCAMKAMNTKFNDNPTEGSRPFDADRGGFVMGEGAGVVVLESLAHAQARGASIYCELSGYAATCDAHHITTPEPNGAGLSLCLERAIADSGVDKTDVHYINAHGTSTAYNDKFETMAIKKVFGEHAAQLAISSTKSMLGHTMGAAGGIEAVVCAKVLQTGQAPPTINYHTSDPDCDLNYIPNTSVDLGQPKAAISDNLGFGGHNAALVFKRFEP